MVGITLFFFIKSRFLNMNLCIMQGTGKFVKEQTVEIEVRELHWALLGRTVPQWI